MPFQGNARTFLQWRLEHGNERNTRNKGVKELKTQVDTEQKKLKDLEKRREMLKTDLRKQEELVSKAESKKRVSLEKFAINEATQEEINKTKRECLEALQERDDTR